jgi:hypothetical protein
VPAASDTYAYYGLPTGCRSADVAVLRCTPSSIGTFNVTIHVEDPGGDKATQHIVIQVGASSNGPGLFGISGDTGYLVLAAIAALAVLLAVVFLLRSRRSTRSKRPDSREANDDSSPGTVPK